MVTYIYTKTDSTKRSMNVAVSVWKLKRGTTPRWIGARHFNTRGWKGAKAEAKGIVADMEGYSFDGYDIGNKSVKVKELVFYDDEARPF